jgi:hypothetical protein
MITGLRGASIWSEDVKNLLPFYRDVLGLQVGFESPGSGPRYARVRATGGPNGQGARSAVEGGA